MVLKKYSLEFAVFLCGAVVMMYEIIGSRVMAPYVGTSTYAWTSLIGVILAALSAGYYAGGRAADAKPDSKLLAAIVLASALGIVFTNLMKDSISTVASSLPAALEVKTLLLAAVLFAPSSFLLGMVSPFAVRLKLSDIAKTGSIAGNLYALSTAGSIAGTFAAGFLIIPLWGTGASLFFLSVVLIAVSALLYGNALRTPPIYISLIFVFCAAFYSLVGLTANADIVADLDTEYNRVWITRAYEPKTKKSITGLRIDPYGIQSAVYADGTDDLVFEYTKFYRLAGHFAKEPNRALLIGGSVLTYPRDFLRQFPGATMDSVEIDPGMTELAYRYFGFSDNPRLTVYHEDGRMFLNRVENNGEYDVIFNDAFNSAASIPFHLTTIEAVGRMHSMLDDEGVVFANIISSIEGDAGKFLRAAYATYAELFPHVYIFPVNPLIDSAENQNLILVAFKSNAEPSFVNINPTLQAMLNRRWTQEIKRDIPVLTDDYAPVEYYRRKAM